MEYVEIVLHDLCDFASRQIFCEEWKESKPKEAAIK